MPNITRNTQQTGEPFMDDGAFGAPVGRAVMDEREEKLARAIAAALEGRAEEDISSLDHPLAAPLSRLIARHVAQNVDRLKSNVALSVDLNEIGVAAAHILRANREIDVNAQGISSAAEELSASIGEISRSVEEAGAMARDIRAGSDEGASKSRDAMASMEDIATRVSEVASRVEALSDASARIGDIVGAIDDIAKKTNLLALNATIEAARAGEAGKGFAVVANEVKALSQQTAHATEDIRRRIAGFRNDISGIVAAMAASSQSVNSGRGAIGAVAEGMTAMHERVAGLEERMDEISGILSQQTEASSEVSSGIADVSRQTADAVQKVEAAMAAIDRSVEGASARLAALKAVSVDDRTVHLAKADHVIWKKRLVDMAAGRNRLSSDELADHKSCRLGRWYYGPDSAPEKDKPAFKALEEPHRRVHEAGIRAARRFEAGDLKGALEQIAEVERASADVLAALDALLGAATD